MRIAVVKNIVAPYTSPVFSALAEIPGIELLVVYEARNERNRRWPIMDELGFQHAFLPSRTFSPGRISPETYIHLSARPLEALRRFRPQVVVGSGGVWHSPTNLAAALTRGRFGWAVVPWWGQFGEWRTPPLHRVAHALKRWYVRSGDAWLAYSTRAREDAIRLGADGDRVVIAPNSALNSVRGPRDNSTRPYGFRFVFSGQLIARKGVPELLAAFEGTNGCELWIAGSGPLLPAVTHAADRNPRVRYLGHLSRGSLDAVYDQADALVLPSRYDVWGLVVNEAFAHGLPVIATEMVGAVGDLVEVGRTGLSVPPMSVDDLRAALMEMSRWPATRLAQARAEARQSVAEYTPKATAKAVVRAAEIAWAAVDGRGVVAGASLGSAGRD
jgi:glycosyltransferase involved in cell wall biosynthesis